MIVINNYITMTILYIPLQISMSVRQVWMTAMSTQIALISWGRLNVCVRQDSQETGGSVSRIQLSKWWQTSVLRTQMTAVPTPTALTWWMDLSVSVAKDSQEMAELAQVYTYRPLSSKTGLGNTSIIIYQYLITHKLCLLSITL